MLKIIGSRSAPFWILAAVLLTACGCNSGIRLGKITRRVTKGGQPVTKVQVIFKPLEGGRSSEGSADENGYYELLFTFNEKGATLGKHDVTVRKPEKINSNFVTEQPAIELLHAQVEVQSGSNTF